MATFLFGRENILPDLFQRIVNKLNAHVGGELDDLSITCIGTLNSMLFGYAEKPPGLLKKSAACTTVVQAGHATIRHFVANWTFSTGTTVFETHLADIDPPCQIVFAQLASVAPAEATECARRSMRILSHIDGATSPCSTFLPVIVN